MTANRPRRFLHLLQFMMVLVFGTLFSTNALAFQIAIDPVGYTGPYRVNGQASVSGLTTVELAEGRHFIDNSRSNLPFDVDASGNVTSLNPGAAQGVDNRLVFNNVTIETDPVNYTGPYRIPKSGRFISVSGLQSFILIPNLQWIIDNSRSNLPFDVDASGNVTSLNPGAAQGVDNRLVFNNVTIETDPVNYTGPYRIPKSGRFISVSGLQSFILIPNLQWIIDNSRSNLPFDVDASGNVTSLNPGAAQGVDNRLVFNNVTIETDPVNYTGFYRIPKSGRFISVSGLQSFILIPNLQWIIDNSWANLPFNVDASGNVTSLKPGAAQGVGNKLVFENVLVNVDPTTYTGSYKVSFFGVNFSGPVDLTLIPTLATRVNAGSQGGTINPGTDQVTPPSLDFTISGETHTFLFSIGSANSPPVADAGGSYSVDEGGSVTVAATGSDPDDDPITFAWDLDNNGTFETPGQSVPFSAAGLDGPSTQTIAVQVTDDGGLSATDQATVNVQNVAPTVGAITAPVDPVQVGIEISAAASFTDPGTPDTHTAVWDWGDESTSTGTVDQENDTVSGTHTYTVAGVYTVTLTVTDDDDGSGESIDQVTITVLTPQQALELICAQLQDIVNNNPGTPLADKIEDAKAKTQTAVNELNKDPADNQAATGNIEGAVGDLEVAVNAGLFDPEEGAQLMDQLAGIARQIAADALAQAIDGGGNPTIIAEAQQALADGDALRISGAFKDAINNYKVGLTKAESAGSGPAMKPAVVWEREAPKTFSLLQNVPNPFNPSTTIRYTLSEASDVRLTIYNALGQEVRALINATQSTGVQSVQWDGRDASGELVATGLYIYRLEAGPNVAIRKMILAK